MHPLLILFPFSFHLHPILSLFSLLKLPPHPIPSPKPRVGMLDKHPGFNSFSNTVGNHSKSQQKNYTRVVGPSADNWRQFKQRYSWGAKLVGLVEDQVTTHLKAEADRNGTGAIV